MKVLRTKLRQVLMESEGVRCQLVALADMDAMVYDQVMAAYHLPKSDAGRKNCTRRSYSRGVVAGGPSAATDRSSLHQSGSSGSSGCRIGATAGQ